MGLSLSTGESADSGGALPVNLKGATDVVEGLVSTVIPVFNRPRMIREAVESVLGQTYRPIEVIVVDDGSTDDTGRIVDAIAAESAGIVRVIHKENGGPGLAREAGRIEAKGEFIQYLDSDDWLLPEKFETQVAALRKNPHCGIAYGVTKLVDDRGVVLTEESKETGTERDFLFPRLLVDRWWHTSTPLYGRAVSDEAGSWPRRRPEDWDLEARMGAARVRLAYSRIAVSCHRHHAIGPRVTSGNRDAYCRDEAWFLPRLFECAIRAGVPPGAPEMLHFSKWAFMRARELGAIAESQLAWEMLELSRRSAPVARPSLVLTGMLARAGGWRVAAAICRVAVRMRDMVVNGSRVNPMVSG